MYWFYFIIILVSPILLLIGLINPKVFKSVLGEKCTRKNTSLLFISIFFISFILFGVNIPEEDTSVTINKKTNIVETPISNKENKTITEEKNKDTEVNEKIINKQIKSEFYEVVKVVDGDTVDVDINGSTERLRLIGINTPETVDPRKSVECFGEEASNKAKDLLNNQLVSLEEDSTQGDKDKYDRLLRYVYLEDGTNFNELMIKSGYAYEYTYNTPYKYQNEFKEAEQYARENKFGLWADGVCEVEESTTNDTEPISIQKTITIPQVEKTSNCNCSGNVYNCGDFSTHAEAQSLYECCGGLNNDIHRLDRDKDGLACETLP